MIRRIILVASLAAVSTLAMVSQAGAQNATVPFSGTVTGTCAFSNIVGGTLTKTSTNEWVEGATGIPGLSGGTVGTATVSCSTGGSLSTGFPVKVSAPAAFTPFTAQALVYDGTNYTTASTNGTFDTNSWAKPTTALTLPIGAPTNLKVGMVVGTRAFTASVPSGTYSYNVVLTATSN